MEFGGSSISVKDERKEFAEMHFKRLKREGFRLKKTSRYMVLCNGQKTLPPDGACL